MFWAIFLPTPSRRGRRADFVEGYIESHQNFYPRPRVEGDIPDQVSNVELVEFLPTPSRRGRRCAPRCPDPPRRYFYPRPRVEGDQQRGPCDQDAVHFYPRPRVEGDTFLTTSIISSRYFYPRPRVEGDV